MAPVILLLLALTLAYLFSRLFFPAYFKTRSQSLTDNKTLTHEDLLELLKFFDYACENDKERGVCHGFTLNWAQAAADNREEYFFNLLNTIKEQKGALPDQYRQISEKVKHHHPLNKTDIRIGEIQALLGLICLAQEPDVYNEIYNKPLAQSNIDQILQLIRFQKMPEYQTARCVHRKTVPFSSKSKLREYLQQVRLLLKPEDRVAIVAGSEEHSLGFRVHSKGWLFIDINQLYKQSRNHPGHILSTEALTQILYDALEEKDHLVLSNCFIAHPNVKLLHRLNKLDLMFPVTTKDKAITNTRGYGLLPMAAQSNDERTVKELLALDNHAAANKIQLRHAFCYAATSNHVGIIRLFCQKATIDLNCPCDSENNSMLGLACQKGHTEAVLELLKDEKVQIDYANNEGHTPLMIACASPVTGNNHTLFTALLNAGASLLSPRGISMLDYAKMCKNQAAIDTLANDQPTPKSPPLAAKRILSFFSTATPASPLTRAVPEKQFIG